jgi:hypothetical protein
MTDVGVMPFYVVRDIAWHGLHRWLATPRAATCFMSHSNIRIACSVFRPGSGRKFGFLTRFGQIPINSVHSSVELLPILWSLPHFRLHCGNGGISKFNVPESNRTPNCAGQVDGRSEKKFFGPKM